MIASADRTATAGPYETVAEGVEIRFVRRHADRGTTFFVRMRKGARAPTHGHPGGEETCMLQGTLRIDRRLDASGVACPDLEVSAGEYAFVSPGETHSGVAVENAVFFVVAAGGVVPERDPGNPRP
jgi:quercetin dioxygenase-like cupin family protein